MGRKLPPTFFRVIAGDAAPAGGAPDASDLESDGLASQLDVDDDGDEGAELDEDLERDWPWSVGNTISQDLWDDHMNWDWLQDVMDDSSSASVELSDDFDDVEFRREMWWKRHAELVANERAPTPLPEPLLGPRTPPRRSSSRSFAAHTPPACRRD